VTAPAGQDFFYNTGALMLLSAAVRKRAGLPLDEFARTALFEPLGITRARWLQVKGGDADAGSGLRLRPRDMAKIGQLLLQGGRWNDSKSFRRHGLMLRQSPTSPAPGSTFTAISGGSAAHSSTAVRFAGSALLAAAGNQSALFPGSTS